jgi:methionyl-tRNA formyltransferase
MRVVFVTHNELGLACLEELLELGSEISAIYTSPLQEDIADQTDLDAFASAEGIPLHRVESMHDDNIKRQIKEYEPELLFVVGWSRLVDSEVLDIPSITSLGMHPAPLPRGRGRAPIAWSIIKGLDETVLSFFHLTEEADAGDIVGQHTIPILIEDDAASLYDNIVDAGRKLIQEYYPEFESEDIPRTPQDDSRATWWPKREPHHGLIDWTNRSMEVYNWIRGQTRPYPGAYSFLDNKKVIFWSANPPTNETEFSQPGEIAYKTTNTIGVGTWESVIEITEVQVEGDDSILAPALLSEYDITVGDRFVNARDRLC